MRHTTRWMAALGLVSAAWLASAQETPAPAPAPRAVEAQTPAPVANPAPTPAPPTAAEPAEIRELEIIEVPAVRSTQDFPAPPDGPDPRTNPFGRREIRIVDGDTAIWVDEEGNVMEMNDVMGRALEFNPELRAIRAEIQALMARLEQLEMKTASEVVLKKDELKLLFDKQKELKSKHVDSPELRMLDKEVAAKKMELDYIVGMRGHSRGDAPRIRIGGDGPFVAAYGMGIGESRPKLDSVENTMLKQILENPIQIEFEKTPLSEVAEVITGQYEINFNLDVSVRGMPIDISLKNVTVRDALAALTDANSDLVFIIREYGIFATTRHRAISIPGPSIPEGVPYSPRAAATPMPAPMAREVHRERVFKNGEHVFERRKPEPEQAEKILDYVEVKPAQPAPKPAPNN